MGFNAKLIAMFQTNIAIVCIVLLDRNLLFRRIISSVVRTLASKTMKFVVDTDVSSPNAQVSQLTCLLMESPVFVWPEHGVAFAVLQKNHKWLAITVLERSKNASKWTRRTC